MNRHLETTEIVTLLAEHRFDLIELHVVRRTQSFQRGEDVVDFAEASSFGNFLGLVPEALRASLRADLATAFDKIKETDCINLRQFGALFVAECSHDTNPR
jgi:hypothetical protein